MLNSIFSIEQIAEKIKTVEVCRVEKFDYNKEIFRLSNLMSVQKSFASADNADKKLSDGGRRWSERKQENLQIVELYRRAREIDATVISENRLADLQNCADYLEFTIDNANRKKLTRAFFCRNRFCNICAWRRSLKLFAQVSRITDYIIERNDKIRFLFVTFTQKNCSADDLKSELDKMQTAFVRITNKSHKFKSADKLKKNVLGYIKSIEITYNAKEHTFHPHTHIVFAVSSTYFKKENYITQADFRRIWSEAMKLDYLAQVNVKAIKKIEQKKAIAELVKYPAKPAQLLNLDDAEAVHALIALTNATRKRRFVSFSNVFRKARVALKLEDIESAKANLLDVDLKKEQFNTVAVVMYRYNIRVGAYLLDEKGVL